NADCRTSRCVAGACDEGYAGDGCSVAADCYSGQCSGMTCAQSENGEGCEVNTDCVNGNCSSGLCGVGCTLQNSINLGQRASNGVTGKANDCFVVDQFPAWWPSGSMKFG